MFSKWQLPVLSWVPCGNAVLLMKMILNLLQLPSYDVAMLPFTETPALVLLSCTESPLFVWQAPGAPLSLSCVSSMWKGAEGIYKNSFSSIFPPNWFSVWSFTVELAMIMSESRKKSSLAASKVSFSCLLEYLLESCCSELSKFDHPELHELCVGVMKASHIVVLMQFNPRLWCIYSSWPHLLLAAGFCLLRKSWSI